MNRITWRRAHALAIGLVVLSPISISHAGTFSANFNDSNVPDGSAVFGSATIAGSGGFTNSPCLVLTPAAASQVGIFVVTSNLDSAPVVSFTANFRMTIGGGTGAGDGFSFNYASDLDLTGAWGNPEEGNGAGLTIEFDTFQNGLPDTAPNIDVKVGGVEVAKSFAPQLVTSTGNYVDVLVQLNPDRTLTVSYDGVYAVSNLDLSAVLTSPLYPFNSAYFGLGAKTGGSYANQFLDDINIVTRTNVTAFVRSFAPVGRRVQPAASLDINLTNSNTSVVNGSIALQLDGNAVTPGITTSGGTTLIHYAPATPFGPYTSHTVGLVFADNAGNTTTLNYDFNLPAATFVMIFSDGFEQLTGGGNPLDMNIAGPNAGPNGGPGNPWFGPAPPNLRVVSTENGVVPHGGTNMTRGSAPSDLDQNWVNLAYRFNGANFYTGNILMDWWFYDPLGPGGSAYRDFGALGYYNTAPATTDYPGTGSLNTGATQIQRLSLGASSVQTAGFFDNTKYQARMVGAADGYAGAGWFNTTTARAIGWHHARVIVGPTLPNGVNWADYYIDDMLNPTFSHIDRLAYGYNVLELNQDYGPTTGYMDDVSFAVGRPPNLTITISGNTATLTWPGLDFTLQSALDATGPYTDVAGATSGYTYDVTSNPQQYFRLRQM